MPGALASYGFLNAKLKARISGLLSPARIEELVRARSLPEAMVLLKGTAYEALDEAYARTGDLRSGESLLYSMEADFHTGLLRYAKEPAATLLSALSSRFEVDTLKNAIRLWFDAHVRGHPTDGASVYLHRGTILHKLDLEAMLAAPDIASLAAALDGTPYESIVREAGPGIEAEKSIFALETALDRHYYSGLLDSISALGARDRAIARRVLGVEIDLHNVEWLVRAQNFYKMGAEEALACLIPGGSPFDAAKTAAAYGEGSTPDLMDELLGGRYGRFRALISGSGDQVLQAGLPGAHASPDPAFRSGPPPGRLPLHDRHRAGVFRAEAGKRSAPC